MRPPVRFFPLLPIVVCAAQLCGLPAPGEAQRVLEGLRTLGRENGERYVQPVYEGFGHALGTGFLRAPDVHGALGFDVGLRLMAAVIPDDRKSFAPVLPSELTVTVGGNSRTFTDPFAVPGAGETPSAAGEGAGVTIVPTGDFADTLAFYGIPASDYDLTFPGGANLPVVTFATVQAGLGVGLGTEVTVRLTPTVDLGDAGSIGGGGFGVTHSLNHWIPYLLVDLAVVAGYQSFRIGDYLDATTTSFGGAVGKGLGPLSAYLIGVHERPSVEVEYLSDNPDANPALPPDGQRIAFTPEIESGTRVGIGAQLSLLLVQFAGEYTKGGYDTFTLRATVGLR